MEARGLVLDALRAVVARLAVVVLFGALLGALVAPMAARAATWTGYAEGTSAEITGAPAYWCVTFTGTEPPAPLDGSWLEPFGNTAGFCFPEDPGGGTSFVDCEGYAFPEFYPGDSGCWLGVVSVVDAGGEGDPDPEPGQGPTPEEVAAATVAAASAAEAAASAAQEMSGLVAAGFWAAVMGLGFAGYAVGSRDA